MFEQENSWNDEKFQPSGVFFVGFLMSFLKAFGVLYLLPSLEVQLQPSWPNYNKVIMERWREQLQSCF